MPYAKNLQKYLILLWTKFEQGKYGIVTWNKRDMQVFLHFIPDHIILHQHLQTLIHGLNVLHDFGQLSATPLAYAQVSVCNI